MACMYDKADKLIDEDKFEELYNLIEDKARKEYDPEACWRVALCHYAKNSEYNRLVTDGYELCDRALEKNPNHARCLTWKGICLNLISRMGGTDEQIRNSFKIKDLWMKSLSIDPNYHVTYNCMGQWCYKVADLPTLKRAFAKAFFSTPPTSTFEDSLKYAEQCYKLKPDELVGNLANLALCYKKLGQKAKAIEFAQKVMAFHRDCIETMEAREDVKSLLK